MDTEKLKQAVEVIEESLAAFRHISLQLRSRKAMLPTLAPQIDANDVKSANAIQALEELKDELGL